MSKKFAVCFSGYPRFVRQQFKSIKENFLDGLGDYDVYAKFQWKDDYKNIQIHHEYASLAGLERNIGADSDYFISSQISAYGKYETVFKL